MNNKLAVGDSRLSEFAGVESQESEGEVYNTGAISLTW